MQTVQEQGGMRAGTLEMLPVLTELCTRYLQTCAGPYLSLFYTECLGQFKFIYCNRTDMCTCTVTCPGVYKRL